jgi:glycyl-tRNA synthetase (class II)
MAYKGLSKRGAFRLNSHQQEARLNMTEETRTPLDFANKYTSEAMKSLGECQGKYAAFVSKRLSEDFAVPQRLADCKTPMEVMDVWADFYSTAMAHYMDHARTMTETGTEAVEEMVREVETEVEEIAEATGKMLKSVKSDGDGGSAKAA